MPKRRILFSNQATGYLFIDVINAFAGQFDCELYTGQIDVMKTDLNDSVKRNMLIRYNRNVAYKRIYTWGMYTLQLLIKTMFKKKTDELFIVTNPPFAPFVGYFLNKIKGTKYHLLIYDVYPDALVNFGIIKKHSWLDKAWSRWNKKLLQKASTIYSLSNNMASLIKQYNPGVNVEVIHNWTDTSLFSPKEKEYNPFAKQYAQEDKITVMYSGNMGATHAVEKIADLAAAFKNDSNFGFMLIGDGAKRELIAAIKEKKQLDNLIMLSYQPVDVLPYSLTTADIGIVTLSAGAEDLSVPSKTYNLLAAGVALLVIASPNSELAKLVLEYDCGQQFEEHEDQEMIAFLKSIENNKARLEQMKANARKASFDFTPANAHKYPLLLNSNAEA